MDDFGSNAQLAFDTILRRRTKGVPNWGLFIMDHEHIERLAGADAGDYRTDPQGVYLAAQKAAGTCLVDQWIPENPLTMGPTGKEGGERGATTGAESIVLDGIIIDSPEAVAHHMESIVFPQLQLATERFNEDARTREILSQEAELQQFLGPDILKTGYGFAQFPQFGYYTYGYANYFMAYALYPELIERHFSLSADLAVRNNRAAAKAYTEGNLPPLYRLDSDMADSIGTLVDIKSLDRIWFPHFARSIEPLVEAGVRLIWHCDGNLMEMAPRLLEVGLQGFQGFQYECGMDYEKICSMRTRDGSSLIIIAGVSVTHTLPRGTSSDVKRELMWLVDNGPKTGLILGVSSSVTPGVPWENIRTLVEGFAYYRLQGRG